MYTKLLQSYLVETIRRNQLILSGNHGKGNTPENNDYDDILAIVKNIT